MTWFSFTPLERVRKQGGKKRERKMEYTVTHTALYLLCVCVCVCVCVLCSWLWHILHTQTVVRHPHDCLQVIFTSIFAEKCAHVAVKIGETLNLSLQPLSTCMHEQRLTPPVWLFSPVNMEVEIKKVTHYAMHVCTSCSLCGQPVRADSGSPVTLPTSWQAWVCSLLSSCVSAQPSVWVERLCVLSILSVWEGLCRTWFKDL